MNDLLQHNLFQIRDGLAKGEFSSRELTMTYLENIEWLEPQLHSFITLTPEQALAQADQADRKLADRRRQPDEPLPGLLGVPLAVKDILCVAGIRCTCGSKILENFIPTYNATAVQRLLESGAVILGKTNTDEFAMGSSTENSAYGETRNPWDLSRVPGGSSGGSAAAVAARLAPVALGTDTGGSVRQPASFCGITGIKPTYGRVSRSGLVAFGSSLDVVGVLGRSAQEVGYVLSLIAGFDPLDSTSVDRPAPDFVAACRFDGSLGSMRIGVPDEYFIPGMQKEVEAAVMRGIKHLEDLGAAILPISLPHTEFALPVYYIIAPAEASANLARYDGIRYGSRVQGDGIWDTIQQTRGAKFGPEVKRRIMLGTYALSAGYYDAYYGQAQMVRKLIRDDFSRVFNDVDIIAAPVAPKTAFSIGEHLDDPLAMYLEDIFTLPANLAGIPAIAFPVGFDNQGLPIGMQLMSATFEEEVLFKSAHAYQQTSSWHTIHPTINLEK